MALTVMARVEHGQRRALGVLAGGLALAALAPPATGAATSEIRFNRDIRPVLSENCFACHGPDKNQRKAKLRLDIREVALEKGAIVPDSPEKSELIARIFTSDEDDVMPPPKTHKKLSAAQKEMFKRWIAAGAEYEPHWAYITPSRPPVPRVRNRTWAKNPIDAFLLEALERRGIRPSGEADKRALLRRLSLDLTGLPPTSAELEAFLADKSLGAYERRVDRLLASAHYGERMAVPWLDVVRFSDTVGYHGDQNQNIFPYRDYVIDSFNRNKPFDQFTIEQLAGDLLPNPTLEQRVATGFNRLNMMTREGGAQPKEYLAKYAADRVRTVAMTWLGSTLGCAECHDHKFDPFTAKDFYSLAAFFADVKQWGVYNDYAYTPNPDLKGWSNDHPFPPELEVASPYLEQRRKRIQAELQDLYRAVAEKTSTEPARRAAFADWRRSSLEFLDRHPDGWMAPAPARIVLGKNNEIEAGTNAVVEPRGSILFTGKPAENTRVELPLRGGRLAAIRIELLPHERHGGRIVRGQATSTMVSLSASVKRAAQAQRLGFYQAEADRKEERYANGFALIGVKDGWRTAADHGQSKQTAVWFLDPPVETSDGEALEVSLGNTAAGCIRISLSPFAGDDPLETGMADRLAAGLRAGPTARDAAQLSFVAKACFLSTAQDREAFGQYKKLLRELLECREGRAMTLVTEAWPPAPTRVLPRGNWLDESGELVEPAPPHFLPPQLPAEGRRLTRLDLARWLVARENPLTARTFVNRLWKQFFGAGLCSTLDDLGLQGDPPSHPGLLDWLAVEFEESGWDVKGLVKQIVLSATYRQSSNLRPELTEIDPGNRLLSSQSPRRLEAEFVRDNALFIAGLLNLDVGGPSAHPYQPGGYYANLQFPDRDYDADRDQRQYRRGIYTHWQRTFLHPMLANFDAPSREECTANRVVSNTPQQALTLLNDPSFVEAARIFAGRLLSEGPRGDDRRLAWAFERALARPIQARERRSLLRFLAEQRRHYNEQRDEARKVSGVGLAPAPAETDRSELAAWTSVCRVIFNLHETITAY